MKAKIVTVLLMLPLMFICSCGNDVKVYNDSLPSTSPTKEVAATYKPQAETISQQELIISKIPEIYTYSDMLEDISLLQKRYKDRITIIKVCETFDGRDVYDVVIGNLENEKQILISGAMHAREYITSQIVMRQLCECLNPCGAEYKGIPAEELMQNVTIHFIPMVNPDGVSICQNGIDGLQTENARGVLEDICRRNNFSDYTQWKANAEGTDINRNFDAGWEEYDDKVGMPAPDHYKGEYPGSSAEADGLIRLTKNYGFDRTISYHTKGSVIYWYYKQDGELLKESREFAKEVADVSGYQLDDNYNAVDAAGYKDWAVYKMNIPSITVEVGGKAPSNPVSIEYFDQIWKENKDVIWAALYQMGNYKYANTDK